MRHKWTFYQKSSMADRYSVIDKCECGIRRTTIRNRLDGTFVVLYNDGLNMALDKAPECKRSVSPQTKLF